MKKDIIISLAVDGREKYSEIVHGLEKSIVDSKWDGDVEIYKSFPDWVIPHNIIPYAFKYQLILKKMTEGYRRVYWLDSTMRLVPGKKLDEIWEEKEYAVIVFDNLGHKLIHYINNTALKNLSLDKEEIIDKIQLEELQQIWGGAIFFDFDYDYALEFLYQIVHQMLIGSFNDDNTTIRDRFFQHRHDQATISGLCYLFDMPILPYGYIAAAKDVTDKTYIQYGN